MKAGSDDKATAEDLKTCRHDAQLEAMRDTPFVPSGPYWGPPYWGSPWGPPVMPLDNNRFYLENRLTNFCMRNKGYEYVVVKPATGAPPSAPPAPAEK